MHHIMSHTVRTEIHLEWAHIRSEHDRMGALRCICHGEQRACTRIAVGRFEMRIRIRMQRPSICFASAFGFGRYLRLNYFPIPLSYLAHHRYWTMKNCSKIYHFAIVKWNPNTSRCLAFVIPIQIADSKRTTTRQTQSKCSMWWPNTKA